MFLQCFQNNETLAVAAFEKDVVKNASKFDWNMFSDPMTVRKFKFITDIGISALDDKGKLEKVLNALVVSYRLNCKIEPDIE